MPRNKHIRRTKTGNMLFRFQAKEESRDQPGPGKYQIITVEILDFPSELRVGEVKRRAGKISQ